MEWNVISFPYKEIIWMFCMYTNMLLSSINSFSITDELLLWTGTRLKVNNQDIVHL